VSEPGTVQGLREHMLAVHGITAPDDALEFALRRARSYSGNAAGVYVVAARWVIQAADAQDKA
jgi:hypothetical protein